MRRGVEIGGASARGRRDVGRYRRVRCCRDGCRGCWWDVGRGWRTRRGARASPSRPLGRAGVPTRMPTNIRPDRDAQSSHGRHEDRGFSRRGKWRHFFPLLFPPRAYSQAAEKRYSGCATPRTMIATVVNAAAVLVGSLLGLLLARRIKDSFKAIVYVGAGHHVAHHRDPDGADGLEDRLPCPVAHHRRASSARGGGSRTGSSPGRRLKRDVRARKETGAISPSGSSTPRCCSASAPWRSSAPSRPARRATTT